MGAGRVLCDDVLRRRMRTCVLSVSSTVGRSQHYIRSAETKKVSRKTVLKRMTFLAYLISQLEMHLASCGLDY